MRNLPAIMALIIVSSAGAPAFAQTAPTENEAATPPPAVETLSNEALESESAQGIDNTVLSEQQLNATTYRSCGDGQMNTRWREFFGRSSGVYADIPLDTDADQEQRIQTAIKLIVDTAIGQVSPYKLSKALSSTRTMGTCMALGEAAAPEALRWCWAKR